MAVFTEISGGLETNSSVQESSRCALRLVVQGCPAFVSEESFAQLKRLSGSVAECWPHNECDLSSVFDTQWCQTVVKPLAKAFTTLVPVQWTWWTVLNSGSTIKKNQETKIRNMAIGSYKG
ncbi:unnamed protein product [Clavelina lepadiformis]|uniref:Uncharacterized protein n=1 Tax=Clavelina lepadiformis TaxID=159417 RepID=A0ABP0F5P0_CLALP